MDFNGVAQYLDRCLIFGIKPSLVRINRLLELLGEPQKRSDFIHIVGSNGKTSTTRLISSILYGQGISCGYHISPHINSYTERIWLNGSDISESDFLNSFERIFPVIKEVNSLDLGGPMTQFEIIAAMAFDITREKGLDVMVLEAGMGGRWDATNAADSILAGLTGVSLEHTSILGNTIEEIAIEKVQVIKNGAKSATTAEDKKVLDILKKRAEATASEVFYYGSDFKVEKAEDRGFEGWELDIRGIHESYEGISLPLLGDYQPRNLSLAIALCELYLYPKGIKLSKESINSSLNGIRIKGRFEVIKREPLVIADASHNPEGIDRFSDNIKRYFSSRKKIIIFSVLKDKDYKNMIRKVLEVSQVLILSSSNDKRSLDIDSLEAAVIEVLGQKSFKDKVPENIYKIDNIGNSLNFALNMAKSSDIICITGSITNLEFLY